MILVNFFCHTERRPGFGRGERNAGWSGFFLTFTVFAAILLLLAREGQGEAVSAGARQVLVIYEGLTCWAVPALFMAWGMVALEEGKPSLTGAVFAPCASVSAESDIRDVVSARCVTDSGESDN